MGSKMCDQLLGRLAGVKNCAAISYYAGRKGFKFNSQEPKGLSVFESPTEAYSVLRQSWMRERVSPLKPCHAACFSTPKNGEPHCDFNDSRDGGPSQVRMRVRLLDAELHGPGNEFNASHEG